MAVFKGLPKDLHPLVGYTEFGMGLGGDIQRTRFFQLYL